MFRVLLDADEPEQFQGAPPVLRPGVLAEPGEQVLRLSFVCAAMSMFSSTVSRGKIR